MGGIKVKLRIKFPMDWVSLLIKKTPSCFEALYGADVMLIQLYWACNTLSEKMAINVNRLFINIDN